MRRMKEQKETLGLGIKKKNEEERKIFWIRQVAQSRIILAAIISAILSHSKRKILKRQQRMTIFLSCRENSFHREREKKHEFPLRHTSRVLSFSLLNSLKTKQNWNWTAWSESFLFSERDRF